MSPNAGTEAHSPESTLGVALEMLLSPGPPQFPGGTKIGAFEVVTATESADGKADRSWIGYGLGNVAGAVSTAISGVMWAAAIFSVLAIICVAQLVRSARPDGRSDAH